MCCFEKGELTSNFRSSKIRLIPKKGDCSKIKNWQPISLLNCFYKIISRAIAERLKKVIGKITNVGQKGYNSSKQCQEVLITLIDEIQTAKFLKKMGQSCHLTQGKPLIQSVTNILTWHIVFSISVKIL
jgi:hypothetical protein